MNKITKESKIIVLGGSGFVGTNMLLYLKSSGYKTCLRHSASFPFF